MPTGLNPPAVTSSKTVRDNPARSAGLADVYEDIPAIAAILDKRGFILALSKEASDKFGPTAPGLIGRSILSLAHRDDRKAVMTALNSAREDNSAIAHCEFRVWRGGKPALKLRTSIRAANSGSGSGVLLAVSSDITDQVLLERQLVARSSELGALANELLVAQNEERRRVAADMHDGVGHSLALAKFHIDGLKTLPLDQSGQKAVGTASGFLQDAIDAIRSLTFALNSAPLQDQGLDAAVEDFGDSLNLQQSLEFELSSRPRKMRLNPNARQSLYRIIRELLVNVIKHAKATRVRVSIGAHDDSLHIAVVDNGIGFGPSRRSLRGSGLDAIRSQVDSLQGAIVFEPGQDGGTRVQISVPYSSVGERK